MPLYLTILVKFVPSAKMSPVYGGIPRIFPPYLDTPDFFQCPFEGWAH
jgi:hypothetical protein